MQDKRVSVVYAEIQDGHQKKWQKIDFWQKVADDTAYTPVGQKLHQNCFCTISRDKHIFVFTQKFKMTAKKWQETDFWQKVADDFAHSLGAQKFFVGLLMKLLYLTPFLKYFYFHH